MTAVLLGTPGFVQARVPQHLSYSQATTLADCGERFRLERLFHVPYPPNIAAIGGKAMHGATDWLDRFDAGPEFFQHHLTLHVNAVLSLRSRGTETASHDVDQVVRASQVAEMVERITAAVAAAYEDGVDTVSATGLTGPDIEHEHIPPTVTALWDLAFAEEIENEVRNADEQYKDPSTWKAFGRKSKDFPDKENTDWWNHHGPIFLMRWIAWRATSGWELIFLDGDQSLPAIEVDCSGDIGEVQLKGFIDRMFLDTHRQPIILDLKSNSKLPSDPKQLGVYRVLLGKLGFPKPAKGVYWWARSGELGPLHDLTEYEEPALAWEFRGLRALRNEGFFTANTKSTTCSYCPVKPYCYAQGGDLADQVPRPWEAPRVEIKTN